MRQRVPEYWLIDPLIAKATVYILGEDGHYQVHPLTSDGYLQSQVLGGLVIEPSLLWRDSAPEATELVQLAQQLAATTDKPAS